MIPQRSSDEALASESKEAVMVMEMEMETPGFGQLELD
jgi:hypothetical protein